MGDFWSMALIPSWEWLPENDYCLSPICCLFRPCVWYVSGTCRRRVAFIFNKDRSQGQIGYTLRCRVAFEGRDWWIYFRVIVVQCNVWYVHVGLVLCSNDMPALCVVSVRKWASGLGLPYPHNFDLFMGQPLSRIAISDRTSNLLNGIMVMVLMVIFHFYSSQNQLWNRGLMSWMLFICPAHENILGNWHMWCCRC